LALQLELAAEVVKHSTDAELVVCVHAYCCLHRGACKPGLNPPLLRQKLGCGPRSKGPLATKKGVPSLSYDSCAILHGLPESLVDHRAEKRFLFQAGRRGARFSPCSEEYLRVLY